MKLNLGLFVILSLVSLFAGAQDYQFPAGKIYNGLTPNNQDCQLQLNSESDGWLVQLDSNTIQSKLLFNSNRKIEVQNAAWISRDMMSQVANGQFESLNGFASNKVFDVLMTCKLNALNEPIEFTLDIKDAGSNNSYNRVVNCQIQ